MIYKVPVCVPTEQLSYVCHYICTKKGAVLALQYRYQESRHVRYQQSFCLRGARGTGVSSSGIRIGGDSSRSTRAAKYPVGAPGELASRVGMPWSRFLVGVSGQLASLLEAPYQDDGRGTRAACVSSRGYQGKFLQ
jgi:hypothetical protein